MTFQPPPWLTRARPAFIALVAMVLYGAVCYHLLVAVGFTTPAQDDSLALSPFLLAILVVPMGVVHGVVVHNRSSGFPVLRRVISSLLAGIVGGLFTAGLAVSSEPSEEMLPAFWREVVSVVGVIGVWSFLPIIATLFADGLLDPVRRWRRSQRAT